MSQQSQHKGQLPILIAALGVGGIGCFVLTALLFFVLVGGFILVDQLNLYCSLPFSTQIFNCP